MEQYIPKSALVAEIERLENDEFLCDSYDVATGFQSALRMVQEFIDTLEVKEVHECNNVDLNPLFEEMGVEPDSRIVLMLKNAFYKSLDNYLDKKKDEL